MAVHFAPIYKALYNEHPAQEAPGEPSLASKLLFKGYILEEQKKAQEKAQEKEDGNAVPSSDTKH